MTGSGTQFNMNINDVVSSRCRQMAGTPLVSNTPVLPYDHVNMAQPSNDSFPPAMYIESAIAATTQLSPSVTKLNFVSEIEFDKVVDQKMMVSCYAVCH